MSLGWPGKLGIYFVRRAYGSLSQARLKDSLCKHTGTWEVFMLKEYSWRINRDILDINIFGWGGIIILISFKSTLGKFPKTDTKPVSVCKQVKLRKRWHRRGASLQAEAESVRKRVWDLLISTGGHWKGMIATVLTYVLFSWCGIVPMFQGFC